MTLFPISLGCYLVSVYHPRDRGNPQRIDWAAHAPAATIQNMGVDQRLVHMVTALLPGAGIHPAVLLWEEVLPPSPHAAFGYFRARASGGSPAETG